MVCVCVCERIQGDGDVARSSEDRKRDCFGMDESNLLMCLLPHTFTNGVKNGVLSTEEKASLEVSISTENVNLIY